MCVGFCPCWRVRSLNALARQTNSVTRIYAGYNINPLSVDPAENG